MPLALIVPGGIAAYLGFAVLLGKAIAFGTGGREAVPLPVPANRHRREEGDDARRGAQSGGARRR